MRRTSGGFGGLCVGNGPLDIGGAGRPDGAAQFDRDDIAPRHARFRRGALCPDLDLDQRRQDQTDAGQRNRPYLLHQSGLLLISLTRSMDSARQEFRAIPDSQRQNPPRRRQLLRPLIPSSQRKPANTNTPTWPSEPMSVESRLLPVRVLLAGILWRGFAGRLPATFRSRHPVFSGLEPTLARPPPEAAGTAAGRWHACGASGARPAGEEKGALQDVL
jgi:hypothetical protein